MTEIPPAVLNAIPPKWLVYVNAGLVISFAAGRVYTSLKNCGGLKGIFTSIWLGSSTVKKAEPPPVDRAQ